MTRLASRFGRVNSVRRDRPLTHDELSSNIFDQVLTTDIPPQILISR